jgi:hypothetical protein
MSLDQDRCIKKIYKAQFSTISMLKDEIEKIKLILKKDSKKKSN